MAAYLWLLIYDEVEITFTVIIPLLKWSSSLCTQRNIGKKYTLMDFRKQIKPSPILVHE